MKAKFKNLITNRKYCKNQVNNKINKINKIHKTNKNLNKR